MIKNNNNIKGVAYEIQIRDYIINTISKQAYLWADVPETILLKNNIIGSHNAARLNRIQKKENKENKLRDTGIDIIQIDDETRCSLVQCKNGYKRGLKISDLGGFNAWLSVLDKLRGFVYYTDKLSPNILALPSTPRIKYIKQPFVDNKTIIRPVNRGYIPYSYQKLAFDKCIEHFTLHKRGIMSLPCGTGKTLISYLVSETYKQVIIISPLKQFARQNLDKYIEYGYKNKTLLIDSDYNVGVRNIAEIKTFIEINKSFLLSSTFCSVDCIHEILKYCLNPLIIVDEFHNISKQQVSNKEDYFYKILNSDNKILFMSATPRVYDLENKSDDNTENDGLETEINIGDIFGEVIYKMSFSEAIARKFITDYRIWLPSIHEDNNQLTNELSIYEIDNYIKAKCVFFFSCLLNNGSKKCIVYCQHTNEINLLIEAMNKLNEHFCIDYKIGQITSSVSESKRGTILSDFSEGKNIQLLFSIRILDECIDIKACDSIFIAYETNSKIRTIQRMSRCMRIDIQNKFKVGNIYIWCNIYACILQTLSCVKEYDIFFKDKIKINETNFHNKKEEEGENGVYEDAELIENI